MGVLASNREMSAAGMSEASVSGVTVHPCMTVPADVETADSRQQTAVQTADSRQQTADSRQQTADSSADSCNNAQLQTFDSCQDRGARHGARDAGDPNR